MAFIITTNKTEIDVKVVHEFLATTYWAKNIPFELVVKSIEHSIAFGVLQQQSTIGFGRLITDRSTFAYLSDIFILPEFRGRGLSKMLVKAMMEHPEVQGLRKMMLTTSDAHGLYEKYDFKSIEKPEKIMQKNMITVYK